MERISKEEVKENMKSMKNVGGRPRRPTGGDLEMSRRECTGLPDETIQENDGK